MIQRIQSLFLLASSVLLFVMVTLKVAQFDLGGETFYLSTYQYSDTSGAMLEGTHFLIQFMLLVVIVAALNLANIFLFKKRVLQIRICTYSIILQVAILGMIGFYTYQAIDDAEFVRFQFGAFVPLVTIILTILAFQKIRKDEVLIRSLDRIR